MTSKIDGNSDNETLTSNVVKDSTSFGSNKRKRQNTKQPLDLIPIDDDKITEYQAIYSFKKWVTGYHVYQDIWTPEIGEKLSCKEDPENPYDEYAVSVILDTELVGHVPRTISKIITNFLSTDGKVELTILANPKRTRRNGIIVPCLYVLKGSQSIIEDAKDAIYNTM